MFLTKDAIRVALPGEAVGEACEGCPPLERLFQQYADGGGELLVCPICVNARGLAEPGCQRSHRRCNPALGVDRRRGSHRLQLLSCVCSLSAVREQIYWLRAVVVGGSALAPRGVR